MAGVGCDGVYDCWRIAEILALRWEDIDVESRFLISRHADNKGRRDERVPVHGIVIEHLALLRSEHPFVFRWLYDPSRLWDEFHRIQTSVGIHLVCRENDEHTPACHLYGFHDFRRAFATLNASRLKPEVLQKMMRHRSYKTTLGYVNLADQLREAADRLVVPDNLHSKGTEPG